MTRGRDATLYAGGLLFQQAISFIAGVAVARWLGPQGYGQVSLARSVYALAVIVAPLGLDLSLLRHLGEGAAPWPAKLKQVRTLRRIVAGANGAVALGVALAAGPWLQAQVYRQPGFALELATAFAALPFAADLAILTALARAMGRVAPASLASLYLQPVVRTAGLAALLGIGWGPCGVLAATGIGLAAADLTLGWSLKRGRLPDEPPGGAASGGLARGEGLAREEGLARLCGYSGWMAAMLLAYNGLKLVDVLALGHSRPAREVGDYAALSAIVQLVGLYPVALSQTLAPTVAGLYARGDLAAVRRELAAYLRRASLVAAPMFAGAAVFGPWLDLLFGPKFRFDTTLCLTLALGAYVGGVLGPMSVSLSMTGRHRLEFAILAVGGLASLAGCLALAPAYGAQGVALATLGGYVLVNGARTLVSARIMGGFDGEASDLAIPAACLALAWIARAMAERLGGHDLATATVTAGALLAAYALLYACVLLRPQERTALAALSRRRWRSGAAAAPSRS